jgi:TRAP-type C4-dicarboxylate transport system permease small subunit
VIGNLLISLFLVAAIWGCFEYAFNLQQAKEDSPALGIPSAPFVYAIAIAFCPIVMIHVTEVVTSIRSGKGVRE